MILCVGETSEQRENNQTITTIETQLKNCLKNIKEINNIVIAYEPIWAIGTGKNASPVQVEEVHKFIKNIISKLYKSNIRVIYGGSVKENNIKELMKKNNIDGALVGGSSLPTKSFANICNY